MKAYYRYESSEYGQFHVFRVRPYWLIRLMKFFGYNYIGPTTSNPTWANFDECKKDAEEWFDETIKEYKEAKIGMFSKGNK